MTTDSATGAQQDPDEIRRQIEHTRQNLSNDVNALADEARPGNVVKRQVEGVKQSAQDLKERVFGAPEDDYYAQYDSGPGALERAQQLGEQAPRELKQRTRGNPLAAGLIAFGIGALIGGMLPTTRREQQLAVDLKDRAQPAVDAAKDAAQEAVEQVKPQAQQAVEHVKESASESAQVVADKGKSEAQDVRDHTTSAAGEVADHASAATDEVKAEAQSGSGSTGQQSPPSLPASEARSADPGVPGRGQFGGPAPGQRPGPAVPPR